MYQSSFVYILASQRNGTLYVGSTVHLVKRIWEHKNKVIPGFTAKYNVNQLVYYKEYESITSATHREYRIKHWKRIQKIHLIEEHNPTWRDLYFDLLG